MAFALRSLQRLARRHTNTFPAAVHAAEKMVLPPDTKVFSDPLSIVSHEMSGLAKLIAGLIGSGHPTLNRVASYYFEAEGKNVRPLVVLLLSKALLHIPAAERARADTDDVEQSLVNTPLSPLAVLHGINPRVVLDPLSRPMGQLPQYDAVNGILPKQRRLAEIVEMIHTALLLHDDVIDVADARRGRPAGNIAFTNKMAVLAGDFLLGRASVAIARIRNPEVIELLSTTIANLVEGEFMQLKNTVLGDASTVTSGGVEKRVPPPLGTVPVEPHPCRVEVPGQADHSATVAAAFEYYLHKTYLKTAALMLKLARAAAVLSGADISVVDACYDYGRNLGLCFQIVDDMLDYTATDAAFGKPAQADLKLGLATAPVLFAWREEPSLGALIGRKFSEPGDVETARAAVARYDGVAQTRVLAQEYCAAALASLRRLPESDARSALEFLTNSVLTRSR